MTCPLPPCADGKDCKRYSESHHFFTMCHCPSHPDVPMGIDAWLAHGERYHYDRYLTDMVLRQVCSVISTYSPLGMSESAELCRLMRKLADRPDNQPK